HVPVDRQAANLRQPPRVDLQRRAAHNAAVGLSYKERGRARQIALHQQLRILADQPPNRGHFSALGGPDDERHPTIVRTPWRASIAAPGARWLRRSPRLAPEAARP